MMLADNGAEVIRIDRAGGLGAGVPIDDTRDVMLRSRRTISLDLKSPVGLDVARRLCSGADGLIEGFRPGVMERLGLGPDVLLGANPGLAYGRMTGWGQDGPYAQRAGHDINYLAVNGVLDAISRRGDVPLPPLNLLGDYAGGGLLLAFGMIAVILAVRQGGRGRVVDCAMTEGAGALMAGIWSLRANDLWDRPPGENLLDGGAPFYAAYRTADGRHAAVGAIETRFYVRLCEKLGLADDPDFADQHDYARWPTMRQKLTVRFANQTLAEFEALFADEDVCFAPVVAMAQAPANPHNRERSAYIEIDGIVQPAPVPRFAGCERPTQAMWRENNDRVVLLGELGFDAEGIEALNRDGAFGH